jgi:threonine dehydrogenase-like Zn-dependent dehydrogenase
MKAWIYDRSRDDGSGVYIFPETVPVPEVGPHEILIEVMGVSVCGTDEALFRGQVKDILDGIIPGHELFGKVLEVGPLVSRVQEEHSVCAESHYLLPEHEGEGIIGLWGPRSDGEPVPPINGGYTEYVVIPETCARIIPQRLVESGFWPSLLEGVGNDYKIAKYCQDFHLLKRVCIIGSGTHGLFTQLFVKHFGADELVVLEKDAYRRGFARGCGFADAVLDPADSLLTEKLMELTAGEMFDCVIDITHGTVEVLNLCFALVRDAGYLVLFGLYDDPGISIDGLHPNDIIFHNQRLRTRQADKNITIQGITGREGVWQILIQEVTNNPSIQEQILKPVSLMGPMDNLGDDTRRADREILKRVYAPFRKEG